MENIPTVTPVNARDLFDACSHGMSPQAGTLERASDFVLLVTTSEFSHREEELFPNGPIDMNSMLVLLNQTYRAVVTIVAIILCDEAMRRQILPKQKSCSKST